MNKKYEIPTNTELDWVFDLEQYSPTCLVPSGNNMSVDNIGCTDINCSSCFFKLDNILTMLNMTEQEFQNANKLLQ